MELPLVEIEASHQLRLLNRTKGVVLAERVRLALTSGSRMRGLLGSTPLSLDEAMLIRPCNGVHTMFMRYTIDVLFIDSAGKIVAKRPELRPWRISAIISDAHSTIELQAGVVASSGTDVGDLVAFEALQ